MLSNIALNHLANEKLRIIQLLKKALKELSKNEEMEVLLWLKQN
jgi:hypothetical protein